MLPWTLRVAGAACITLLALPALGAGLPPLRLSALPDDAELAAMVWQLAPELVPERGRGETARAEALRAHVLPNPALDLSWNTIPIGPTNPVGLSPLADVPNYVVSLSTPLELGKRGPR